MQFVHYNRMNTLSVAEAKVIRELLADRAEPQRIQIHEAGIPRSTFQAVRRKALANGWIFSRYLPNPRLLGVVRVRFDLTRPYADYHSGILRKLQLNHDLVLLWDFPGSILSVVFDRGSQGEANGPESVTHALSRTVVQVSPDGQGISSYFDYEGEWSKWSLAANPLAYPRGLSFAGSVQRGSHPLPSWVKIADISGLLARPPGPENRGLGSLLRLGPARQDRLQRLLEVGALMKRSFLIVENLPSISSGSLTDVVFVSGARARSELDDQPFQDLTTRSRVAPFLFVSDARRVLMAFLAPAPSYVSSGRVSVMSVLKEHLRDIEVVRERVDTIRRLVDQRFDRLVGPYTSPPVEIGVEGSQPNG
jgi:hypothetical protein